eukprot:scaffold4801_cov20-Tisochrysis_lutea.AAC.2
MDPSTKRAAKIEQFKANKALTTQLAALEDKRAKAMKVSLSKVEGYENVEEIARYIFMHLKLPELKHKLT